MKKLLAIILCVICILTSFSCKEDDSATKATTNKKQVTTEQTEQATPEQTKQVTTSQTTKKERIVYVSKSGKKIHSNKKCSGMKYYKEMTYDDAVDAGYEFCTKCY